MITATTAAKLRTIRAAGLSRVRKAAQNQGIRSVERDMKILRDVAHGSTVQAAEKNGVSRRLVEQILDRYEKIARSLNQAEWYRKQYTPGIPEKEV